MTKAKAMKCPECESWRTERNKWRTRCKRESVEWDAIVRRQRATLERTLPLLVKLGDYHDNADGRCETILEVKRTLGLIPEDATEATAPVWEEIGQECSICRRRHGREVTHACE